MLAQILSKKPGIISIIFFDYLLQYSTTHGIMSAATEQGDYSMAVMNVAAQFFFNYYYFFNPKK